MTKKSVFNNTFLGMPVEINLDSYQEDLYPNGDEGEGVILKKPIGVRGFVIHIDNEYLYLNGNPDSLDVEFSIPKSRIIYIRIIREQFEETEEITSKTTLN